LFECVAKGRPDVLLAVQRDCEIWTETLDAISALGSTRTVVWTTDDSWKYREVSRFIGRHYDAITTTYDYLVPRYQRDGIDSVLLTQWAANPDWLREPLPAANCKHGVSFVGAAYGQRREVIAALKARGIAVECFGDGWARGPVAAADIPAIMNGSQISLNFSDGFKAGAQRQIKARTFEVPGAGGLLLTEDAPGIEKFYRIGSEILSYKTIDEMERQIRWVCDHPDIRDQVAMAGYLRTRAEHTYDKRLLPILEFALDSKRRRRTTTLDSGLHDAIGRHRMTPALTGIRSILTALCAMVWKDRGKRAARRAVFELSWRLLGESTFGARGLPGRLFPEI
jgi:spore maturation protein CgeB